MLKNLDAFITIFMFIALGALTSDLFTLGERLNSIGIHSMVQKNNDMFLIVTAQVVLIILHLHYLIMRRMRIVYDMYNKNHAHKKLDSFDEINNYIYGKEKKFTLNSYMLRPMIICAIVSLLNDASMLFSFIAISSVICLNKKYTEYFLVITKSKQFLKESWKNG